MNMNKIANGWDEFERRVVPKDAGPIQREEMRMSFFAGSAFLFGELTQKMPDSEDKAIAELDEINEELTRFSLAKRLEQEELDDAAKANRH